LTALLVSTANVILPYIVLASLVIVAVGGCNKLMTITGDSVNKNRPPAIQTPLWAYAGIYTLYALIVFERMNCAFTLFARGLNSSVPYYVYFIGGIIMAIMAYWLFVYKTVQVSVALNIFLFLSILSIAIESGLMAFSSINAAFLGFSDIIYVFLFVTAASISNAHPDRKVFMGFVFVFGFALIGGFVFSHYLFVKYQSLYTIIYSLTSLSMIAVCILMIPVMRKFETNFTFGATISEKAHAKTPQPFVFKQRPDRQPVTKLTSRENEIVNLYLKGYSNQQVAEMLYIAPATLKVHCRNIYNKLNIKSRLELHFLFQDPTTTERK
jgi:DNA-binding CsgD family transcriptional regulator